MCLGIGKSGGIDVEVVVVYVVVIGELVIVCVMVIGVVGIGVDVVCYDVNGNVLLVVVSGQNVVV